MSDARTMTGARAVKATVHGAISIVNAIATGKGATLGTSMKLEAIVEASPNRGRTGARGGAIRLNLENRQTSHRLINKVVEKMVPPKVLEQTRLDISLLSEIPTGYGLKSSSAISSAIALACAKLFWPKATDLQILLAGINASIETKVSLTGAYDDACGCYYGGFHVTDNYRRKIIRSEKGPQNLFAVIFIPKSRKRGNIKKLKKLHFVFEQAWALAKKGDYWNAMILNGLATATILNSDPDVVSELMHCGAVGASLSGNGPAIAAVAKKQNISSIKNVFSSLEGRVVVCQINNKKAEVYDL